MKSQDDKLINQDYESRAPDAFICPIACVIMKDPYMDDNGISYEKQSIFQWVIKKGRHPTAGRQMKIQELKANRMLKDAIEKFKAQFKSRIRYQVERHEFQTQRLDFQAATKLQFDQLIEHTAGYENSQIKKKEKIQKLEDILANKQRELQSIRDTARQISKSYALKTLEFQSLQEEIKELRYREQNAKIRQYQMTKIIQQLSQKNKVLELDNQSLNITQSNLINELVMGKAEREALRCQLLISQKQLKQSKQKLIAVQSQRKKGINSIQEDNEVNPQEDNKLKSEELAIQHPKLHRKQLYSQIVKLTPNVEENFNRQKNIWRFDSTNSNICIANTYSSDYWLCSSSLPLDGEFLFTIKVIKVKYSEIAIGVMESQKKGERIGDTLKNCVFFKILQQAIRKPNQEQSESQLIKYPCQYPPKCPFQITCHVNRQQNTIAWHYAGRRQAKSTIPNAWKTERKQLYAIVWTEKQGDTFEMM